MGPSLSPVDVFAKTQIMNNKARALGIHLFPLEVFPCKDKSQTTQFTLTLILVLMLRGFVKEQWSFYGQADRMG